MNLIHYLTGHGTRRGKYTCARRALLVVGLAILCCLAGNWAPVSTRAMAGARPPASEIDRLLARMTPAQRVEQMFMVPIGGMTPGWHVGGVILFRPDVVSAAQGRALIAAAQRMAALPLLVATDEEGGEVDQMSTTAGVQPMLAPRQYGYIGSAIRVYHDALITARELRSLGVNMDLAPVLDVLLDPSSPIGSRSYGWDPAIVARLGTAAIRGYQHAGIAATAKHFLGLGGVSIDAHVGLPVVSRSLKQLDQAELVPMRAAIAVGVDALMVTHAAITALDPSGTPASLSRPIVTGFIRGRLGYHGLIITDSLSMGALSTRVSSIADAAVRAVVAGNDMILISADAVTVRGALAAVQQAVATGHISLAIIDAAAHRVLALKAKLGLLPHEPATP